LGLHTLLTRDLITGLVRVIHGVDGLCKACKRKGKSIVFELSGSLKDPIIRKPSKRSK